MRSGAAAAAVRPVGPLIILRWRNQKPSQMLLLPSL